MFAESSAKALALSCLILKVGLGAATFNPIQSKQWVHNPSAKTDNKKTIQPKIILVVNEESCIVAPPRAR